VLRREGVPVWFSEWELKPSDSIADKIEHALAASDALVVLLSPAAVESSWVNRELDAFLSRQLRDRAVSVIPVVLKDCQIPASLASVVSIDLRYHFDAGVKRLAEQLAAILHVDFAKLTPHTFERLVADLLNKTGFEVDAVGRSADGGVDLVVSNPAGEVFSDRLIWAVQVKHYRQRRVGVGALREFLGAMMLRGMTSGLMVTSGNLTSVARDFTKLTLPLGVDLRVIDGAALTRLLIQYPELVQKYFSGGADT
jgi:restriction endonuclease Mrr